MIQWWFNEQTQLQRCLRVSCGKIPLPESLTVVSTGQNAAKQPVKNKKHMTSKRNKLYFAGTELNLKTHGFVISHARPSKDDFVSCGKGGHHLWFCLILSAGRGSDSSQLVKY